MLPLWKTPPICAGAKAVLALLCTVAREDRASDKDPHGAKWCRKRFVGRVRQRLGPIPDEAVVPISGGELTAGRREAAVFFRDHCQSCALCEMGRVMPPTHSQADGSRDVAS